MLSACSHHGEFSAKTNLSGFQIALFWGAAEPLRRLSSGGPGGAVEVKLHVLEGLAIYFFDIGGGPPSPPSEHQIIFYLLGEVSPRPPLISGEGSPEPPQFAGLREKALRRAPAGSSLLLSCARPR